MHRPQAIGHFSRTALEWSSSGSHPLNVRRSAQVRGIVVTASTNPVYSASVQKGGGAVDGGAVGARGIGGSGAAGCATGIVMLDDAMNLCVVAAACRDAVVLISHP